MNELQKMQRILDNNEGQYLLAYRTKYNDEIQRGLPVYVDKHRAEKEAEELVKDIDVVIKCWVEAR